MKKRWIFSLITSFFIVSFPIFPEVIYNLAVNLMPEKGFIRVYSKIEFLPKEEVYLILEKNMTISKVRSSSGSLRTTVLSRFKAEEYIKQVENLTSDDIEHIKIYKITPHITQREKELYKDKPKKFSDLEVEYYGVFRKRTQEISADRYSVEGKNSATLDRRGVFFVYPSFWYPFIANEYHKGEITVYTPMDYLVVSEGSYRMSSLGGENVSVFKIKNPVEYIDLVGGRLKSNIYIYEGIKIGTFFSKKNQKYSEKYIKKTVQYIKQYENLFGKYPFTKFFIVENFLQTGYGMPSFTLLGSKVITLPFIINTSLGHEILHNWWGNSVYVDYSQGNWCEGLTVLYADHYYKELTSKEEAKNYRFNILKDYSNYVSDKNEISLSKFRSRVDPATRTIGYGKGMMFFYMLKNIVGNETFINSLKKLAKNYKFKKASYDDIRKIIEEESGLNLKWFFEQWIKRKGAPQLTLKLLNLKDKTAEIEILQTQKGKPYRLFLPYKIIYNDGTIYRNTLEITGEKTVINVNLSKPTKKIIFDPDYEIFRKLFPEEIPPSIGSFLGKEPIKFDYLNTNLSFKIKTNFPNKNIVSYAKKTVSINPGIRRIKNLLIKNGLKSEGYYSIKIGEENYNISELSIIIATNSVLYIQSNLNTFPEKVLKKLPMYGKYGIVIFKKDNTAIYKKEFLPDYNSLEINF